MEVGTITIKNARKGVGGAIIIDAPEVKSGGG